MSSLNSQLHDMVSEEGFAIYHKSNVTYTYKGLP